MNARLSRALRAAMLAALGPSLLSAQDAAEMAKKLANPLAALISVPLQFNHDQSIGPAAGNRQVINVQPVLPVSISPTWNLITRVITPVIFQHDVAGNSGSQPGLGDMVPTFFFSPKAPTSSGIIWGAGPVFLLPTATDKLLGARKFGVGPSAVVLSQSGPVTVGALVNHIWSVAGDGNRPDVNSTFLQPFVSYSTKTAASFALSVEATHDGTSGQWSVPLNANVSQVLKLGPQLVSLGGGVRYWMGTPSSRPSGLGFRLTMTFMFPKR